MRYLIILNDPPYGTERTFNGLRLAISIRKGEDQVKVFLLGDASVSAKSGQKLPSGYYSIETMLTSLLKRGTEVAVCGTCLDARGIGDKELVGGSRRSTIEELTAWTAWADKVLVF